MTRPRPLVLPALLVAACQGQAPSAHPTSAAVQALARAGKIKPTPMKEEPMADVQKWIEELRAGKVVGRIVLKN